VLERRPRDSSGQATTPPKRGHRQRTRADRRRRTDRRQPAPTTATTRSASEDRTEYRHRPKTTEKKKIMDALTITSEAGISVRRLLRSARQSRNRVARYTIGDDHGAERTEHEAETCLGTRQPAAPTCSQAKCMRARLTRRTTELELAT